MAEPRPVQSAPIEIRPFFLPILGVQQAAATVPAAGVGPAEVAAAPAPRCYHGFERTSGLEYFSGNKVRFWYPIPA